MLQFRERVMCLREWMPELGLADCSEESLLASMESWLKPALRGKTRLDNLQATELNEAISVIGGGDSLKALKQAGCAGKVSLESTGGGAFLEVVEGKIMPGIAALDDRP